MTLSLHPNLARSAREIASEYLDTVEHAPSPLFVMLQNVQLNPEKSHPPLEQIGEFWFWKLSCFGLDLMLALSKSSTKAFSFADSSAEDDPHTVPQFQVLLQIRQNLLKNADWERLFAASDYLKARQIDTEIFQIEVETLIKRVDMGIYDTNGHRNCLTMREYQRMVSVSQA